MNAYKSDKKNQSHTPKRGKYLLKKRLLKSGIFFTIIIVLYLTVAYSNIPLIKKWRTLYIETAMTTNSHQWLATLFFPQKVIDEVMSLRTNGIEEQKTIESTWDDILPSTDSENTNVHIHDKLVEESEIFDDRTLFFLTYWELDTVSFHNYIDNNPNIISSGYDKIKIEDLDAKLNLKTSNGDSLLVLDAANNLMIIGVKGENYVGKLAILKNPSQLCLAKSSQLGTRGQEASGFGNDNDALLVVNASGFEDAGGVGSGGHVKGSLIIDGTEYSNNFVSSWKFVGMKYDNRMYISNRSSIDAGEYRWGVDFFPALIVDGEQIVNNTYGMGIQPRTVIGQTLGGDVLMLVIDGRQIGYSLGTTVKECASILLNYHAYQAINMDGGSSSIMWYNGNYITSSSSVTGRGRYMPDAFIVKRADT